MNSLQLLDLSLDALDQVSPNASWGLGELVAAACLLEASAPKAGNVHPTARFDDMDYEDFRRSARVTGEVFERLKYRPTGSVILEAVRATRDDVGKNTNLGIVLLLGPLATAASRLSVHDESSFGAQLKDALESCLKSLTADDSEAIYKAIAIAKPGGMGRVDELDVSESPPHDLLVAMRSAAERDDVAKQYVTGFSDVFDLSDRIDAHRRERNAGWFTALVQVQLERLSSHGDSLIARKNDRSMVEAVQRLAYSVMQNLHTREVHPLQPIPIVSVDDTPVWQALDQFLRADGHRRNPGTTADLLAAATFVCLLREYNAQQSIRAVHPLWKLP